MLERLLKIAESFFEDEFPWIQSVLAWLQGILDSALASALSLFDDLHAKMHGVIIAFPKFMRDVAQSCDVAWAVLRDAGYPALREALFSALVDSDVFRAASIACVFFALSSSLKMFRVAFPPRDPARISLSRSLMIPMDFVVPVSCARAFMRRGHDGNVARRFELPFEGASYIALYRGRPSFFFVMDPEAANIEGRSAESLFDLFSDHLNHPSHISITIKRVDPLSTRIMHGDTRMSPMAASFHMAEEFDLLLRKYGQKESRTAAIVCFAEADAFRKEKTRYGDKKKRSGKRSLVWCSRINERTMFAACPFPPTTHEVDCAVLDPDSKIVSEAAFLAAAKDVRTREAMDSIRSMSFNAMGFALSLSILCFNFFHG